MDKNHLNIIRQGSLLSIERQGRQVYSSGTRNKPKAEEKGHDDVAAYLRSLITKIAENISIAMGNVINEVFSK